MMFKPFKAHAVSISTSLPEGAMNVGCRAQAREDFRCAITYNRAPYEFVIMSVEQYEKLRTLIQQLEIYECLPDNQPGCKLMSLPPV